MKICSYKYVDVDDMYGRCAIALCRAAQLYNPTKYPNSDFFTFAFRACARSLCRSLDKQSFGMCSAQSLDYLYSGHSEDETDKSSFLDMRAFDSSNIDDAITEMWVDDLLKDETVRNQSIIRKIICGDTQKEVADEFGISRQRVSQIFGGFSQRVKECVDID